MKTKIHLSYLIIALCLLPVSILAKDNNEVVATINTGLNPLGVAVTPDGNTGYVANNNSYNIEGEDTVSVLDLKNNLPIAILEDPSFNRPFSVTIGIGGKKAYVTNSGSTTITVINTATNAVSGVISGFDGPSGMVITPSGNRAYVNNYGSADGVGMGKGTTVRVVDLNSNSIIGAPIEVGMAPSALAISPNGQYVYVVNYEDGMAETGTLDVIRTSDNTVISTIAGFSGPTAIELSPNGKFAYVTNAGDNNLQQFGRTVSVVNLTTNQIINSVDTGIQPSDIALGNNCLAYVINNNTLSAGPDSTNPVAGQGTVSVINLKNNMVVAPTILVGQSPASITLSPSKKYAYVSNYTSNTVSVIKLKK